MTPKYMRRRSYSFDLISEGVKIPPGQGVGRKKIRSLNKTKKKKEVYIVARKSERCSLKTRGFKRKVGATRWNPKGEYLGEKQRRRYPKRK